MRVTMMTGPSTEAMAIKGEEPGGSGSASDIGLGCKPCTRNRGSFAGKFDDVAVVVYYFWPLRVSAATSHSTIHISQRDDGEIHD